MIVIFIAIIVIGVVWIGLSDRSITENFEINTAQTKTIQINLNGGVGFYVTVIEGDAFVQVLNPDGNIIADKKIDATMAVNYFDIEQKGEYTIKMTNVGDEVFTSRVQVGEIDALYPGLIIGGGVVLIMISAYKRLLQYGTARGE